MNSAEPIRLYEDVQRFKNYYLEKCEYRNYLLISVGLNTALRISDIIALKWSDVFYEDNLKIRSHIVVREQKTGKVNAVMINNILRNAFLFYAERTEKREGYIFVNREGRHISRVAVFKIIKRGGEAINLGYRISCHTLRKTFGYHAWKKGIPPAVLQQIYNHSSFEITKRYLGITQDDKDDVYCRVML